MTDEVRTGRRSTDADLAVVIERLDTIEENHGGMLRRIFEQTAKTNGRVSELEVKERIRQDREEQKAIRDAAAEAAKYRIETSEAEAAQIAAVQHDNRLMRSVALKAAGIGAGVPTLIEAIRWAVTGHP